MFLDLRRIVRSLLSAPGFAAVVVATLALAIGANTAIFSVIDAALLRPLPFPEPDRLVAIWEKTNLFGLRFSPPAFANYADWRAQSRSFEEMGLHEHGAMLLTGDGDAEEVPSGCVTAGVFRALGSQPIAGRYWTEGEDLPGAAKTVVLSHGLWQRRFAADPRMIGRTVQLGGAPYTVVGIMPPTFAIPGEVEALWVPFGNLYDHAALADRGRHNFFVVGRLKPSVTLAQANADLHAIATRLQQAYPATNTDLGTFASPLAEHTTGPVRPLYLVLAAAVGLLLFTACANISNLMLARLVARSHETAVRLALGAARRHLLRHSLLEAGVLGALGGGLGVFVALWGVDLLRPLVPPELAAFAPLELDWRVLGFAGVATLLTVVLIGCAPLWRLARSSVSDALRRNVTRHGPGLRAGRFQSALVVVQLALSLTLIVGAGLLVRTFAQLRSTDLGFRSERVVVARLSGNALWRNYGHSREARSAFYRTALERVTALPGVAAVGFTNGVPLLHKGNMALFTPERPLAAARPDEALTVNRRVVTPGYFAALGVPLLRGRALAATDVEGQPLVAVVNLALARKLWPDLADPVGQRIRNGDGPWATVVGIVGDMRQKGVDQPAAPEVYFSCAQHGEAPLQVVVRTAAEPQALAADLRRETAALDSNVPIVEFLTLDGIVDRELSPRRFQSRVLGLFAGLALLVAALGLYGVVAYAVAQRTREFGIRAALGASRRDILAHVLGRNLRLLLPGLALGCIVALLLSRLMAGILYGVAPHDPLTFAAAILLLLASGLLACWLPTRRATRVDPAIALRSE
ncbi:MAG TPA: ABC transporter permease [Opitutaceae bacterium]|nr:ABC transporter permease [Opitutaceae bacterium]